MVPAYKMAVNWVTKTMRRMIQRKTFKLCEVNIGNCEVMPQAT